MKLNDNQVETSDPSTVQGQNPGPMNNHGDRAGPNNGTNDEMPNNSYFIGLSYFLILLAFILN